MGDVVKKAFRLVLPVGVAGAIAGACQGDPPAAIPITGTLEYASGSGAQLTTDGNFPPGGDFVMRAELDGQLVVGTGGWRCFAPDPEAGYPNFDIEATDGNTWGFFLAIGDSAWTVGTRQITGSDTSVPEDMQVRLLIAAQDRFGTAEEGTVTIHEAPTSAGTCSFTLSSNLALVGERESG